MTTSNTLSLFTGSYPYEAAAEHTFLDPEMIHLRASFEQIIIVPGLLQGEKRPLPGGVEVEERFAADWAAYYQPLKAVVDALRSGLFWREILKRPLTLLQPRALKKAMWWAASSAFICRWVCQYVKDRPIDPERTVFYTYWLDHLTLGIGLAKTQYPELKLVSRAHNYDLYERCQKPPYFPYRARSLADIDRFYAISADGRDHIAARYPQEGAVYQVSRLGVRDPGFKSRHSEDGAYRILSCSFMVPFKRLDLLYHSLEQLARSRPEWCFEWHHIGGGPLLAEIKTLVEAAPQNLSCHLEGQMPNEAVMAYYRDNPVDVFVNVSFSEGIPVSIMEAQSCGIPVVATAVGGTPEIVSEETGVLLPENPTPEAVAAAVWEVVGDREAALKRREGSFENWQSRYNADENFQQFAKEILSLIKST